MHWVALPAVQQVPAVRVLQRVEHQQQPHQHQPLGQLAVRVPQTQQLPDAEEYPIKIEPLHQIGSNLLRALRGLTFIKYSTALSGLLKLARRQRMTCSRSNPISTMF